MVTLSPSASGPGPGPAASNVLASAWIYPPPPTSCSVLNDGQPLPKIIVFDIDYTLWPFWVDTHVTPPLKPARETNGGPSREKVVDATGEQYAFYADVPAVLLALHQAGVKLALASRTHMPNLAREMMGLLWIDGEKLAAQHVERQSRLQAEPGSTSGRPSGEGGGAEGVKTGPAKDFFAAKMCQIYPGSKLQHMKALQQAENEGDFNDILFFDDEERNSEVEKLGVVFHLVRDGVTWKELDTGVKRWRRKKGIK